MAGGKQNLFFFVKIIDGMKKNKLVAYLLIFFVLLIPVNIGFLSIDDSHGLVSLIMMILVEFVVVGALILGVDNK